MLIFGYSTLVFIFKHLGHEFLCIQCKQTGPKVNSKGGQVHSGLFDGT